MTEEAVFNTLKEIYAKVPQEWRKNVVTEKAMTPTMSLIVEKALESPDVSEEKKEQLRQLKDSGYFSKKQYSEDPKLVSKIDNLINREINKAVKEGRLPNKKKLAELKEIWKKQKETSSTTL